VGKECWYKWIYIRVMGVFGHLYFLWLQLAADNWKTKKGRDAAHATTNVTLKCGYYHKDGHNEDRCLKEQVQRSTESAHSTREVASCIYETTLVTHAKSDGTLEESLSLQIQELPVIWYIQKNF
jgi:hypothetical protein